MNLVKKFYIPIYGGKVKVYQGGNSTDVMDVLGLPYDSEEEKATDALVYGYLKKGLRTYVIWFKNKTTHSVLSHEVTHLVNWVFRDLGVVPDLYNDEPQAYFTEYLYKKISKFISFK